MINITIWFLCSTGSDQVVVVSILSGVLQMSKKEIFKSAKKTFLRNYVGQCYIKKLHFV